MFAADALNRRNKQFRSRLNLQTNHAGDGLVRNWAPPDFGADQHRSYMMQWYSFAVIAAVLWLVLNWRREETMS